MKKNHFKKMFGVLQIGSTGTCDSCVVWAGEESLRRSWDEELCPPRVLALVPNLWERMSQERMRVSQGNQRENCGMCREEGDGGIFIGDGMLKGTGNGG